MKRKLILLNKREFLFLINYSMSFLKKRRIGAGPMGAAVASGATER